MVDVDRAVDLAHRPAAHRRPRRDLGGKRNLDTLAAVPGELPAVKRTAQVVSLHHPAAAQVRSQVRAVGVEHPRHAVLGPEQDQLLPEVVQRHHPARSELLRESDDEPAVGIRVKGKALGHGLFLRERFFLPVGGSN